MSDDLTREQKQKALEEILRRLPSTLLLGASTLGAVFVSVGGYVPEPLAGLAVGVGYEIFSSLTIDSSRGKKLSNEELESRIQEAIDQSDIVRDGIEQDLNQLLKERDFHRAVRQLYQQFSLQNQELQGGSIKPCL